MSYFGGGSGSEANRFVGQLLDLGEGNKLKVKKVIAEGESLLSLKGSGCVLIPVCVCLLVGGFGYVFVAQDASTGKDYALKVHVGVCAENKHQSMQCTHESKNHLHVQCNPSTRTP